MKMQEWIDFRKVFPVITAVVLFSVFTMPTISEAKDRGSLPAAPYLTLKFAKQAAMSALWKCRSDGYAVSVAVVDRHGVLLTHVRDPLAGPHTVNSAQGKAFTSASMGQPTSRVTALIAENRGLDGLRDMDSRMVILAGGLPIVIDGMRVGGIGVGGAPGGQLDEACAAHGLQNIGAE
ncbi:(Y14336) putative extracellular protein containing predicted 35aa signal peptide [hydrothermal vent metagenome]|uniref:(Y14336) putative extracellular protein containing predicted 35aa signal peptide n=1 Tax=hydrothermal vent metagenome TaxID=652676 RepID=A0A3B0Z7Z6_9ZZZZ